MPHNCNDNYINAFIDLNNVPYLLGEYLDRQTFRQIDGSYIKNELNVVEEEMRAIVEISVDDIGKRSDGYPCVTGNLSKQQNLYNIIKRHAHRLEHRLDVLRSGIVLLIGYQLESSRTGKVIRSAQETVRISDRNYFININPRNVNDNAIVINFYDHLTSSINHFTHGSDNMIIRLTNLQMFYECTKRNYMKSPYDENVFHSGFPVPPRHHHCGPYHPNDDYYHHYEQENFNAHHFDDCNETAHNPSWNSFNRFYNFANGNKDIELHMKEIYNKNTQVFLLPCGVVTLNRTFIVNSGHRIIFKFNIWKNDLVSVNDTTLVSKNLGVQCNNEWDGYCDPKPSQDRDQVQDHQIHKLWQVVNSIAEGNYLADYPGCHHPHIPDDNIYFPPHHDHHDHHPHHPNPPHYEHPGWKITLYPNGGKVDNKEKRVLHLKTGLVGDILPIPIWQGYTFESWKLVDLSTGKMTNIDLTPTTPITSNLVAVATWDNDTDLSVIFDANGGKIGNEKIHTIKGLAEDDILDTSMPADPVNKGDKFTKWILGVNEFTSTTEIPTTLVVYAMWNNKDPYDEQHPYIPVDDCCYPPHIQIPISKYEIAKMIQRIFNDD